MTRTGTPLFAAIAACYHRPVSLKRMGALMVARLHGFLFVTVLVAAAAAVTAADARSLSARALYGKWCSSGGSEQFDDDTLTAVTRSGTRHRFKITRYEVTPDTVIVHWINDKGERVSTDFGEFSADRDRMVQMRNEDGPRREFHRCR